MTTRSLLVGVAWSTVYEVYFYIVFTFLLFIKVKKKNIIMILFSLLFFMKIVQYLNPLNINNYGTFNFLYSIAGKTFIIPFIIGIVIGMYYKKPRILNFIFCNKLFFKILFVFMNIGYLLLLFAKYEQYKSYLITSIIFSLWLMIDNYLNINYKSKISVFSNYIGNISYSIYLLHMLVIEILFEFLDLNNIFLVLILCFFFTFILSYITYNLVEKPFINKSKHIVKKIPN